MAVSKTKSGNWEAKVVYRDNQGKIKTKEKVFKKKSDAMNFDREYRQTVNKDVSEGITYSEIFEEYLKVNQSSVLPRTVQSKRTNAQKYWSNLFNKRFIDITKKDYLNVWIKITSSDKSHSSKNKAIKYLKSVSKYAYLYYDFPDNTKHLQLIEASSEDIHEVITWNQTEFNRFIKYVDNETYRSSFIFYYDTGATLSEVLAIKKTDLNKNKVSITDLPKQRKNTNDLKIDLGNEQ
ncbi:hypothetical protein MGH68_14085 [Erysipelothrix sp. D19-032]